MATETTTTIDPNNGMTRRARFWANILSQVGFPIVCALVLFYFMFHTLDQLTKALQAQTAVLVSVASTTAEFQRNVSKDHAIMISAMYKMGVIKSDDLKQFLDRP